MAHKIVQLDGFKQAFSKQFVCLALVGLTDAAMLALANALGFSKSGGQKRDMYTFIYRKTKIYFICIYLFLVPGAMKKADIYLLLCLQR